jgi:hypothetical protein
VLSPFVWVGLLRGVREILKNAGKFKKLVMKQQSKSKEILKIKRSYKLKKN